MLQLPPCSPSLLLPLPHCSLYFLGSIPLFSLYLLFSLPLCSLFNPCSLYLPATATSMVPLPPCSLYLPAPSTSLLLVPPDFSTSLLPLSSLIPLPSWYCYPNVTIQAIYIYPVAGRSSGIQFSKFLPLRHGFIGQVSFASSILTREFPQSHILKTRQTTQFDWHLSDG